MGPGERPPVHASEDDFGQEQDVHSDDDEEAMIKKIENIKRAQGVMVISSPTTAEKCYQLNVVVSKAENIHPISGDAVHPFISCRVNGCVLTTKIMKENQNPHFLQKLMFPITCPVLNDKITMRIWSKVSGFSANHYIANIPEHPTANDFFNISKLISCYGRMSTRWFNLYGPHPLDRGPRTKGLREGSVYLGRVLLAFSISPNDYPQLSSLPSNPLKEPKQSNFQAWVDLYELVSFDVVQKDENIWVQVSQGPNKSEEIPAKWKDKTKSYVFAKTKVDALFVDFPEDFNQIPDIFVNIFCNKGMEPTTRVGYIRFAAKDVTRKAANPQWVRIKSPYNDVNASTLGQIMMNVQFLRHDPLGSFNPERVLVEKGKKQAYKFYYQILSGFEIATQIDEDKLDTCVEIQIGNLTGAKKIRSEFSKGRYPVWNCIRWNDV